MLDQIDHMVALVGPDHAGPGSDSDGVKHPPAGLEDVSRKPAIAGGENRHQRERTIRRAASVSPARQTGSKTRAVIQLPEKRDGPIVVLHAR